MSSPSVPQNGVYRESPIPRKTLRAQGRASLAVAIIDSFPVGDGQVKSEPPSVFMFAPVMYELRRDAKNATTEPISSGSPARGRWAGCPKCLAMASISWYGSLPSTPTDVAQPTSDSEAMLPGETTLTRISSLASKSDKFLETLVSAALAAVYAGSMTLWRCVECAEKLTIR